MYQLYDGQIVACYDKEHLMPFVERIVPWLPFVLGNILTTQDRAFAYPTDDQSNLIMAGLQPVICSELFCGHKTIVADKPVLFICNDSWLSLHYAKELAKRHAKLQSLLNQVPIVYVGANDWEIMQ